MHRRVGKPLGFREDARTHASHVNVIRFTPQEVDGKTNPVVAESEGPMEIDDESVRALKCRSLAERCVKTIEWLIEAPFESELGQLVDSPMNIIALHEKIDVTREAQRPIGIVELRDSQTLKYPSGDPFMVEQLNDGAASCLERNASLSSQNCMIVEQLGCR